MTPVLLTNRPTSLLVPAPIEDATRREFITGVGAAALAAAFLAACGGEDDGEATPDPSETIDFAYEDITTTIPRNPQRVVVMEGRGDLDFALSAGYPVVATGSWTGTELPSGPFEGQLPEGVELLPTTRDYETLVRLQPDLIIQRANAYRGDFYGNEQIEQIAPVLSVECNRANWRLDLEAQAALLGRDERVAEQLARYDAAVAEARESVGSLLEGKRVALTTIGGGFIYLWTSNFGMEVANDLGMELPFRNSTEGNGTFMELSEEHYNRLEGVDLIFGQNWETGREEIEHVETWSRLPAVQAGRVVDFPGELNNGMALTAATLAGVLAEGVRVMGS